MTSKFTFLAWLVTAFVMVALNGFFHGIAAADYGWAQFDFYRTNT